MAVFAVVYTYDPAKHQIRMDTRPDHRAFLAGLFESGTLIAGGAWADDGAPGGLLIARGDSASAVAQAFDADPYRASGVLAARDIREWAQLFGPWAE